MRISPCVFTVLLTLVPAAAGAQTTSPFAGSARPFEILDNSFLVEEAFNQERGIVQNIFNLTRMSSTWQMSFTQEWPLGGQRHQFSYTLPFLNAGAGSGIGDALINYRLQVWTEEHGRPAFSPRVSVVVPSGDVSAGRGSGGTGLQFNAPFSRQVRDVYFHWNAGLTWIPDVESAVPTQSVSLSSPQVAGSVIWRTAPMIHVMFESAATWQASVAGTQATRQAFVIVSPGARFGWNFGDRQLVFGLAAPLQFGGGSTDAAGFVYASYELPFRR